MRARRARQAQLAPKIGHEQDSGPSAVYVQGGPPPSLGANFGGNGSSGVYAPSRPQVAQPRTPPNGAPRPRGLYDPYAGQPVPQPPPPDAQRGGGGGVGALAILGGVAPGPADAPKHGRRARTIESDDRDRSRQERLLQYQEELRQQVEAEKARKKAEKDQRRREDYAFEARVEREAAGAPNVDNGAPRRRDPNAPAGGASGAPKFGRRAPQDAGAKAKEQDYRRELEEQIELRREAKRMEMRAAEAADAKAQHQHQQQQQQQADFRSPASHGKGNSGAEPFQPNHLRQAGEQQQQQQQQQQPPQSFLAGAPQHQQQDFGGLPPSYAAPPPPQPQTGDYFSSPAPAIGNQQYYTSPAPPPMPQQPGSAEIAAFRSEILGLLAEQKQHAAAGAAALPPQIHQPLAVPSPTVAPPPPHRGYSSAFGVDDNAAARPLEVQKAVSAMYTADSEELLRRFVAEDGKPPPTNTPSKPEANPYYQSPAPPDAGGPSGSRPLALAGPPTDGGESPVARPSRAPAQRSGVASLDRASVKTSTGGALQADSEFVRKSAQSDQGDWLGSNIELDSEPPQFLRPTTAGGG